MLPFDSELSKFYLSVKCMQLYSSVVLFGKCQGNLTCTEFQSELITFYLIKTVANQEFVKRKPNEGKCWNNLMQHLQHP